MLDQNYKISSTSAGEEQKGVDHLKEEDLEDAIGCIGPASWPGVSYQLRVFACVAQWPYSIRVLCKMA